MSDSMNFRSALRGFNREDVVHYIEYINATHASEIAQLRAELENARGGSAASEDLSDAPQVIAELEAKLAQQAELIAQLQAQAAPLDGEIHTQEEWDANIDARIQAEFDRDAAVEAREQAEAERDAAIAAKAQAEAERDAAIAAREQAEAERDVALEAAHIAEPESEAPVAQSSDSQRSLQQEELEAYRRAERTERIARERASKIYHLVDNALSGATARVEETFSQIGELTGLVTQQLENLQSAVTDSRQALAEATVTLSQIRPEDEEV